MSMLWCLEFMRLTRNFFNLYGTKIWIGISMLDTPVALHRSHWVWLSVYPVKWITGLLPGSEVLFGCFPSKQALTTLPICWKELGGIPSHLGGLVGVKPKQFQLLFLFTLACSAYICDRLVMIDSDLVLTTSCFILSPLKRRTVFRVCSCQCPRLFR